VRCGDPADAAGLSVSGPRVTVTFIDDVRNENTACSHVPFASYPEPIAAISIEVDRRFGNWESAIGVATEQLLEVIRTSVSADSLTFFVWDWRVTTYIGRGMVARHKRYWASSEGSSIPSGLMRGPEVEIGSGSNSVAFASAARIPKPDLAATIGWVRRGAGADAHVFALPSSTTLDEDLVRSCFHAASAGFQEEDASEFVPFAKWVTDAGGLYVRVWGFFDDPDFSLQLYFRPDTHPQLCTTAPGNGPAPPQNPPGCCS
jgi:hypothetical protein